MRSYLAYMLMCAVLDTPSAPLTTHGCADGHDGGAAANRDLQAPPRPLHGEPAQAGAERLMHLSARLSCMCSAFNTRQPLRSILGDKSRVLQGSITLSQGSQHQQGASMCPAGRAAGSLYALLVIVHMEHSHASTCRSRSHDAPLCLCLLGRQAQCLLDALIARVKNGPPVQPTN